VERKTKKMGGGDFKKVEHKVKKAKEEEEEKRLVCRAQSF
jgi:uncharacterized protein HemY